MNIIILTPVKLLGDGLAACCNTEAGIQVLAVVSDLARLRETLATTSVELVLIDVTQGVDLYDVRSLVAERPDLAFVAIGLHEQRQEVIRCGRAGFAGYIARDASIESLCNKLEDIVAGRLACPAEISSGLLRALFHGEHEAPEPMLDQALTRRESDVLYLIGRGLTNKEIARELCLSVATVKHHVHSVLRKLNLPRRTLAMQRVRDAPWIAASPDLHARKRTDK